MNEFLRQVHPDLHSPVPQQHVLDLSHLLHVRTVPGDNSSDVSHSNHLVNSSTGSVKVVTTYLVGFPKKVGNIFLKVQRIQSEVRPKV